MTTQQAKKPRILYIDDEEPNLVGFKYMFREYYDIYLANSTAEGYEIMQQDDIQIVISDQRMPDETGVEFFARIRPEFPDSFRMLLTGYSDVEAIIDAINKGHVYYYFQKPWKEEEVRVVIDDALDAIGLKAQFLGKHEQLRSTCKDITERRRVEKELEVLSERLSLATQSAKIGVWDWDITSNTLVWDDIMHELYGIRREPVTSVYEAWKSSIHPDDLEKADTELTAALRSGEKFDTEFRVVWPNGEVRHIRNAAIVLRDDNGNPSRMISVSWDVSASNEAGEALRKSERRLKEAQKIAKIGHWELDFRSDRLVWSDEIYRIFEVNPQHFKATYEGFLDAIHPDDREFVNNVYADSVRNKTDYNIEHRLLMKDGSIKYVNERGQTEYDESDNPLRSIGTVQDISELKAAEEKVRKLNEDLEERVKQRTAELEIANRELYQNMEEIERFNRLTLGREERILALKEEVNKLVVQTGQDKKYTSIE